MAKKMTLEQQAEKIIEIAESSGVQGNYFFAKTFKNYQVQLQVLFQLEEELKKDGVLVTKEYVKGRKNVYSHPAILDFNRTMDSTNKTVTTLMRIIKNFGVEEDTEDQDPLMKIINGEEN